MKKIIFTLTLMLSIIICVAGYGSNTSGSISNKDLNGAYTQISKDEVKEQSTSVITITINPEFKLFLDGEKRIIAVKCLNNDAESSYNEIELLGHVYEAGLNLIVEKAVEKNFITSSSKINAVSIMAYLMLTALILSSKNIIQQKPTYEISHRSVYF